MKRALPFLIIAAVLVAASAVGWLMLRVAVDAPVVKQPPGTTPSPRTPARGGQPGAEPPHAIGPANAPVTLEVFADFQCPPCAMFHPVLKTVEKKFSQQLRVIFRQYPIVPTHAHALSAARAAEAAGLQGKFFEMRDVLYQNRTGWKDAPDGRPIFEGYATEIGLDLEKYRRDVHSQFVEQRIFADWKRAQSIRANGTPAVYINGREIPFESLAPERLPGVIQDELAAKNIEPTSSGK